MKFITLEQVEKIQAYLKEIFCIHQDIYIYRARYYVSEVCVKCGKKLYASEKEYNRRKVEFFYDKYGEQWRQYIT